MKLKKCKSCEAWFTPIKTTQPVCSKRCELIYNTKHMKKSNLQKSKPIKKKSVKSIDEKLDDAWSLLVKLIAGEKCEYCGVPTPLNSHHIYSRSKRSTRWLPENGCCLCVAHHTFSSGFSAHKTPTEFVEWIKEKRGLEWYENLRGIANKTEKLTTVEKCNLLDVLNKRISDERVD